MIKNILFILCAFNVSILTAQSIKKTMLRLPDTGQNISYTNTFGEDNDYNFNTPLFRVNGNGTVTDSVTGLMWQQTDGGEMTIENAIIYCDTLTLAGYSDWRLPNAHEAFSILNHQNTRPAMEDNIFVTTSAEYWWTVDRQVNDVSKIWVTNAGGGIGNHPKNETISAGGAKQIHVRAVRDTRTPTIVLNHFTNNGNGTITDNLTNLVWQQTALPDSLTWENALNYADTFSIAGINDWRLPNIKEIQSINDESRINPSVNTTYFQNIGVGRFWSSTTLPNQTSKAWYLDTHFGITTYQTKTSRLNVLLVRGSGQSLTGVIETPLRKNILVYPNPFKDFIKLTTKSRYGYELLNSIGEVLYSGNEIETQDFSLLPNGIYFLKMTGETTTYEKLIKQ